MFSCVSKVIKLLAFVHKPAQHISKPVVSTMLSLVQVMLALHAAVRSRVQCLWKLCLAHGTISEHACLLQDISFQDITLLGQRRVLFFSLLVNFTKNIV